MSFGFKWRDFAVGDLVLRKGEYCKITRIHWSTNPPNVTIQRLRDLEEINTEFAKLTKPPSDNSTSNNSANANSSFSSSNSSNNTGRPISSKNKTKPNKVKTNIYDTFNQNKFQNDDKKDEPKTYSSHSDFWKNENDSDIDITSNKYNNGDRNNDKINDNINNNKNDNNKKKKRRDLNKKWKRSHSGHKEDPNEIRYGDDSSDIEEQPGHFRISNVLAMQSSSSEMIYSLRPYYIIWDKVEVESWEGNNHLFELMDQDSTIKIKNKGIYEINVRFGWKEFEEGCSQDALMIVVNNVTKAQCFLEKSNLLNFTCKLHPEDVVKVGISHLHEWDSTFNLFTIKKIG